MIAARTVVGGLHATQTFPRTRRRCRRHDGVERVHQALALAVNRSVVPRQGWSARTLEAQDKVDIVRAIGGG